MKLYRGKEILEERKLPDGTRVFTIRGKKSARNFIVKAEVPVVKAEVPIGKIITPKHAHFVIDLYGKLCSSKDVGRITFRAIEKVFEGSPAEEVLNKMDEGEKAKINGSPGYSIEYILNCLELIFVQEDVNYPPPSYKGRRLAFDMLKDVMEEIHPVEAMLKAGLRI